LSVNNTVTEYTIYGTKACFESKMKTWRILVAHRPNRS